MRILRSTCSCIFALACLSAPAQEGRSFGVQASLLSPLGTLKSFDSRGGYAVGLFLNLPVGTTQFIRPRLDSAVSQTQSQPLGYGAYGYTIDRSAKHLFLGADYGVYTSGSPRGLYLFVGAGLMKSTLKEESQSTNYYYADNTSFDHTRSAFTAGLGWTFDRHWGVEARLTESEFSYGGISLSTNWVQVGATLRF